MLTPAQEIIRKNLESNPKFICNLLQLPFVRAQIQANLGPIGEVFVQNLISNEALLQQRLSNPDDPFTVSLVTSAEQTFVHILQNMMQGTTTQHTTHQAEAVIIGPSSHSSQKERGSERGFTILYSPYHYRYGLFGRPVKQEEAKNIAPADLTDLRKFLKK